MAKVTQQRIHRIGRPQSLCGHTQRLGHGDVRVLEFRVGDPLAILPVLLLVQVPVACGTVAGGTTEQRTPLLSNRQPRPIETWQEAEEEGQSTL